jgi:N-methylhydantoinase B
VTQQDAPALHRYRSARAPLSTAEADPVTTEIIRNSLNSAANQMMRGLIRTAFSPIIYETQDFAVAIYDARIQMLAQAAGGLPVFMGTLSFCVEAAVEAVGGAATLEPGDALIFNDPYGTGSHAQDVAIIMPVFHQSELIGYTANKAHNMDIGAKDPYCTDTVDVFQEGLVLPGVKLFRRGERVEDLFRILKANSRMPLALEGDLNAQVTCCRLGADLLERLFVQHGSDTFWRCVARMYDHGERMMRSFIEALPDGHYVGKGHLDNNGIEDQPLEFDIIVDIEGSTVRLDFSNGPPAQVGPINCPLPSTVSASRVAIAMLAGFNEPPNEGHFRVIEVITKPGSMYHPVRPQPCFSYGKGTAAAVDAIFRGFAQSVSGIVPSGSNGDTCVMQFWGSSETGEDLWAFGSPLPSGQGAHDQGDGPVLYTAPVAFAKLTPMEIDEVKAPVIYERSEIAPDTAGPGRHRGGTGWQRHFRLRKDASMVSWLDRTRVPSWGQQGGLSGTLNRATVVDPDGNSRNYGKATNVKIRAGSLVMIEVGGGGGYGSPAERDPEAVLNDVREGYVSEAHARKHYPHAFRR